MMLRAHLQPSTFSDSTGDWLYRSSDNRIAADSTTGLMSFCAPRKIMLLGSFLSLNDQTSASD